MSVDIDPTGRRLTVPGSAGTPLPAGAATDATLVRLACDGAEATLYGGMGCNLIDWRVPVGDRTVQVLHAEDDVLAGGSGTRSGCPILFPFPNRIANARYQWDGRTYQLPVAHPGDRHAIHGFCAKRPWREIRQSGPNAVAAEFLLSRDAPDALASWPGDLGLQVTFELTAQSLRITADVTNPGGHPVPFGLGYHPYFTALAADSTRDVILHAGAHGRWVLADLIPTGEVVPVSGATDLADPMVLNGLVLDDVLTDLDPFAPDADGLMARAGMTGGGATLAVRCDGSFRDLVVFTPENRRSVAIEPYTCPTDAVHLAAAGRDVGWHTLAPGDSWRGIVEFTVSRAT